MMANDHYFKASDEAKFDAALASAGIDEGDPNYSIDRIGLIEKIEGIDDNGEAIIRTIEGYHVNMRTSEPLSEHQEQALAEIMVSAPAVPYRVWG